ncbi:MAG: aldehyde dehydrogenase [Microthrixaceae bacterium]|nr:aldehyde dehydrogenase [Acidimicrobiales bacterium]MCB9405083.1 aldehyde dehydrogenase [Microthrixaceae bacterium]
MIVKDRIYIGGQLVEPSGSTTIDVVNPFTEEVAGRVPEATTADVDRAVAAARQAFESDWSRMAVAERAEILARASQGIQARMDDLTRLITTEMGSPYSWCMFGQVLAPTMVLDYYAELGKRFELEETRPGMFGPVVVRKEPVGVAAAVVPWNVPLFVTILKLAPAFLAGCTVVLKPAPETPLSAYDLHEIFEEAGLPAGVLNIVAAGREVGEHLVTHPGVDKVGFTGSTAAGKRIASLCGELLRPCTLELGGKSAAVVLEDADLDLTVQGIIDGGILNNGQACVAQTRILAPRSRYDEVVDALTEAVAGQVVGDPMDPATQVGPLVADRQRDRVLGLIDKGKNEGARITTGGGRPALERGFFVDPTVFADVTNDMTIAREEIFGPVLSVIAYEGVDDAVAIANDSPYGLSGSVWSADGEAAAAVARRMDTGTVTVNHFGMAFGAPFGGYKDSGLGRELGPEGVDAYLQKKSISLDPSAG